jgi:hypothetical protein
MAPRTRRVPALGFFAVVVEDPQRQAIDRVLLYAAGTTAEAEEMALAFSLADGKPPLRYRFSAQPITEVSGPGDVQYHVVLRRLPAGER